MDNENINTTANKTIVNKTIVNKTIFNENNHCLEVNYSFKQLNKVPESILDKIHIEELLLNDNQLTEINDDISKLKNLKWLYLYKNKLDNINSKIGDLKELIFLDLFSNKLQSLPKEIGKLSKLNYLDISNNPLAELPDELVSLKNLNEFIVDLHCIKNLKKPLNHYSEKSKIFYFLEGAHYPLADICKTELFSEWKSSWIYSIKNLSEREAFIHAMGFDNIVQELESEIIDSETDAFFNSLELHRVKNIQYEPIFYLKTTCFVKDHIFIQALPSMVRSCREALNWSLFDFNRQINIIHQ